MSSQPSLSTSDEMDTPNRKESLMTTSDNTSKMDAIDTININARILAQDIVQANDTRLTRLNNNDLIIGPTGAGKTRGYVIPVLIHNSDESFIVADTKGNLHRKYGEYLRARGYDVQVVDFVDCLHSPTGYDPLRFIGRSKNTGRYLEQDILRLAQAICPVQSLREPYWEQSAQMVVAALAALVLERFEEEDQTLKTVCELATRMDSERLAGLFQQLSVTNPESFAAREFRLATAVKDAEKTFACIMGMVTNALQSMSFDGAYHLLTADRQVDFASLGHRKTVLFLTVSDNDRSLDRLVNLFYTQAIQELVREADRQPDSALPVPVRLILDDFATNTVIPDFDKVITTIRSREISVSLIVQDLTQLNALYGPYVGPVIANNCDTWLYLGGQDVATAEKLSKKLGRTVDTVLSLGLDEAILFRRGNKSLRVQKYDLCSDELHNAIEASWSEANSLDDGVPAIEGGAGSEAFLGRDGFDGLAA